MRDLKALLIEANQKVPPFLHQLDALSDDFIRLGGKHTTSACLYCAYSLQLFTSDDKGCAYCGGLGHRITECPKLEAVQQKKAGSMSRRDFLAESAADY